MISNSIVGKQKKPITKRYLRWVSESPGNLSLRDLNPDLREKNPPTNVCVCLCVNLCEKVCLSHKCTSSFPGSDFSQDKAT